MKGVGVLFFALLLGGCSLFGGNGATSTNITMAYDGYAGAGLFDRPYRISVAGDFNSWKAGESNWTMVWNENLQQTGGYKYSLGVTLSFGTNKFKYCYLDFYSGADWIWISDMRQATNLNYDGKPGISPRPTSFEADGYGGYNAVLILNR